MQTCAISSVSVRTCTRADRAEMKLRNEREMRVGERWRQERSRYSEDSRRGQVRCCAAGGRPQRRAGSEQVTGSSAPSSAVPRHSHSRSARWTPLAIRIVSELSTASIVAFDRGYSGPDV